jgi:flagellar secretion chaperone FliS
MEQPAVTGYTRNSKLAAYQSVAAHGAVANADPHTMVAMVLDAAMERLAKARGAVERGEPVLKAKMLHSAVLFITELRGSLNMAEGGQLSQNLSALYEYMQRRLIHANANNDLGAITEVSSLLENIRSAWSAIGPTARNAPRQALPAA